MLERLEEVLFERRTRDDYEEEIQRAVQRVYVDRLMGLAANARMPQVRALASWHLSALAVRQTRAAMSDRTTAHRYLLRTDIERFLARPMQPTAIPGQPDMPPGSPIGDPSVVWLVPARGGVLISTDMPDLSCSYWNHCLAAGTCSPP